MAGITGLPQLQKNMERLMDESKEWITPARPQLEHMTTWGWGGGGRGYLLQSVPDGRHKTQRPKSYQTTTGQRIKENDPE